MATPTTLQAGNLRIDFEHVGDRWRHALSVCVDGTWHVFATSVEGTSDDRWPSSPALQELAVERHGECDVALLVGNAGTAHWSASIEADAATGQIVFDIALRSTDLAKADFVGSKYRGLVAINGWDFRPLDGAQISSADGLLKIHPSSASGKTARWRYSLGL